MGAVVLSVGDVTSPVYGRSSNKPMQAVAMLRLGLAVDDEELAIVAASHSGEPRHLVVVERILAEHGLTTDALGNTPWLPMDVACAHDVLRRGGGPAALTQNCSGKHAGMVATCVVNGWPIDTYLSPHHPLQRAITDVVRDLTGESIGAIGVDGCGAPVHAVSLVGLARAYQRLVTAPAGTAERRVADAMRDHPELVGGTGRDVTLLMQGAPDVLAKDGAEGVFAAAAADGRAVALKIEDGGDRARPSVLLAAFDVLGIHVSAELRERLCVHAIGHGHPVGEVRALPLR
jgi:L-asparaginase II